MKIYLDHVRTARNMSIRQLAKASGVSKAHIERIEAGESVPSILVLCKLAEAMGVYPETLYKFPENMRGGSNMTYREKVFRLLRDADEKKLEKLYHLLLGMMR